MRKAAHIGLFYWLLLFGTVAVTARTSAKATEMPTALLPAANSPKSSALLGSNLAELQFWSTGYAFLDAFKMSHEWYTQSTDNWNTGENDQLSLDSDGWVTSLPDPNDPDVEYRFVGTVMLRGINGHFPGGQYVVLYDGEGTIEYGYSGNFHSLANLNPTDEERTLPSEKYQLSFAGDQIDFIFDGVKNELLSTPGRDVLNVTPDNDGIYLKITETDPNETGDYIRNIRVIMPGYESTYQQQIFHPDYLSTLQTYTVLRFMDWMRTNNSSQVEWADRATPTYYTYASEKGVPLEIMVELANRLEANPWFTMPHQASDDYLDNFAAMALAQLDVDKDVYVEYSNEIWNGGFPQGSWVEVQGEAEWPSSSESGFAKRMNWYGKRTAESCDRWRAEWSDSADRINCILSSQAANSWTATKALDCTLWSEAPCADHGVNALAVAPYFGAYIGSPEHQDAVMGWATGGAAGLDALFMEIEHGGVLTGTAPADGALAQVASYIVTYQNVAQSYGLELLNYEGGQHLVGFNGVQNEPEISDLFQEANRDERMGEMYDLYLDSWMSNGGDLFVHYYDMGDYTQWGSWGVWEHMDQISSAKFDALQRYATRYSVLLPAIFR